MRPVKHHLNYRTRTFSAYIVAVQYMSDVLLVILNVEDFSNGRMTFFRLFPRTILCAHFSPEKYVYLRIGRCIIPVGITMRMVSDRFRMLRYT
jgi:hypothetical protein